jgi:hypothetical protein
VVDAGDLCLDEPDAVPFERGERPAALGQRPQPAEVPELRESHEEPVARGDHGDLLIGRQPAAKLVGRREPAEAAAEDEDLCHVRSTPLAGSVARPYQPTAVSCGRTCRRASAG